MRMGGTEIPPNLSGLSSGAVDGFRSHRTLVESCNPERIYVPSDRFARFQPLAGVFAGLLLSGGLIDIQHSE